VNGDWRMVIGCGGGGDNLIATHQSPIHSLITDR
jgi:hypothetical protein